MAKTTPMAASEMTNDEPPNETNVSGTAVTGTTPATMAMFKTAWNTSHIRLTEHAQKAKTVVVRRAMRWTETVNRPKSAKMNKEPINPSSSPMIAKMKSVCASGIQCHFCRLWPMPTPHQPSEANV